MASYTSVSLMSTSTWNISGSPIVSPSRWNPLVASNLCVIAFHDHSGSEGEGAASAVNASMFPTLDVQYIWPWFPTSSTCWVARTASNWPGNGYMATSSIGAVLEYDIYMKRTNISGEIWTVQWFAADSGSTNLGAEFGCCVAGIDLLAMGAGGSTLTATSMPAASFSLLSGFPQTGPIYYGLQIFTSNSPTLGVVGNGRMIIRFRPENVYGTGLADGELRIGLIKITRTS